MDTILTISDHKNQIITTQVSTQRSLSYKKISQVALAALVGAGIGGAAAFFAFPLFAPVAAASGAAIGAVVGAALALLINGVFVKTVITPAIPAEKRPNPAITKKLEDETVGVAASLPQNNAAQVNSVVETPPLNSVVEPPPQPSPIRGIGYIENVSVWKKAPEIDDKSSPDQNIRPAVMLPGIELEEYNDMRRVVQQGIVSEKGISEQEARKIALRLGGIAVEGTLQWEHNGESIQVHSIYQTGLNLAGYTAGGIPAVFKDERISDELLRDYILNNAKTALFSAYSNSSEYLVFNLGIGLDAFAPDSEKERIKEANIAALCQAYKELKESQQDFDVTVVASSADLNGTQKTKLQEAEILLNDDVNTWQLRANLAKNHMVSSNFDADPLMILGVTGSDILRNHVIEVFSKSDKPQLIAALSEYMVEPEES